MERRVPTKRLDVRAARHFRDELRSARAAVLADGEAFAQPLHVLERLGRFWKPEARNLGEVGPAVIRFARGSPLSVAIPAYWPELHRRFDALFEMTREARNDAMHVGALARYLTGHCIEMSLILEDALHNRLAVVGDYMVAGPVAVESWQPVSHARRLMLTHSFSYLPLAPGSSRGRWRLIADHQIARYVRVADGRTRKTRLAQPLRKAMNTGLETVEAATVRVDDHVSEVAPSMGERPLLVLSRAGEMVGILTAFDLL